MTAAENKDVIRRWLEIWNTGDFDDLDELMAADVVLEDPVTGTHHGPREIREFISMFRDAFGDLHFHVEEQLAEGDAVATRWTCHGTHEGDLMGISPTGKDVTVTGIAIVRIAGGKITIAQGLWDALGMFHQLDAMPETVGATS